MQLNLRTGKALVKLAREAVEDFLKSGRFELNKVEDKSLHKSLREVLQKKAGAFVSIHTYPERTLRGCIGFTSPLPLWEVVQHAACSAAFGDPRFPPMAKDELGRVVFEISILTEPEELKCSPSEYAKNMEIGKDGLVIQCGSHSGLLLPQVAVEQSFSPEEFLECVCFKAGLTPDYLHDKSTKLWKFQAQIFAEKTPDGEVEETRIKK